MCVCVIGYRCTCTNFRDLLPIFPSKHISTKFIHKVIESMRKRQRQKRQKAERETRQKAEREKERDRYTRQKAKRQTERDRQGKKLRERESPDRKTPECHR